MTRKGKPKGYFTRVARTILEEGWEDQYLRLGEVKRWEQRDEAWEQAQEKIGFGLILQLAQERFNMSESQVLTSNQNAFRDAGRQARHKLATQGMIPFNGDLDEATREAIESEIHTALHPIRDLFLKKPGADQEFGVLTKVADLDFNVIYDMVVVRDTAEKQAAFSKEDYDFFDDVRRAMKATKTQTLRQVFRLDEAV